MAKILVLCAANPAVNPRPNHMIELLKSKHQVSAMGINTTPIKDVKIFSYPAYKKRNILQELKLWVDVAFRKWEKLIYTYNRLKIIEVLKNCSFDVIICHDLVLLPIVLAHKKKAKILFDAREFYPVQNITNLRWRILFAKFNDFLCKKYLPEADVIITVSEGLKKRYKEDYGVDCKLFFSLPNYHNITPSIAEDKHIKLIYHGAANPNRKIQNTIKIIDYLESRFCLDLMLVNTDDKYMQYLTKMIHKKQLEGKKIRIIPPVTFEQIIPFSSHYDIGIYNIFPTNFNLKHALPNKFFEYIQARLALVITPNQEMTPFIQKYRNGIIIKNFSAKKMAQAINKLDIKTIQAYKKNSSEAAKKLNLDSNEKLLNEMIYSMLK
ncbi:glycosyltransferase [Helicobacter cappadocius]|uniref:Capsular biosynthesis protein n=1 Tax=Helicobacter cappadocius TaxID=3063998 RepID=A0AA90PHH0_9HELI|nr:MULTISPECIES: glycosyltransferase [unclassified Helicobacter]MDO7252500.1 capsular biosynthesis protein [Helicobacter sp. faydin-H75]MDP2538367.1 capsular biosynthesis protein [Helicobacter sp. faydin-H76]